MERKYLYLAQLLLEYRRSHKLNPFPPIRTYNAYLKRSGFSAKESIIRCAAYTKRYSKYARGRIMRGRHTKEEWAAKKVQYGNRCIYCGAKGRELTKDHITPISNGGVNTIDNILPACRSCNSRKHTKRIEVFSEGIMAKLL